MTSEQLPLQEPISQPVMLNTHHARTLLRARYPAPEWVLLEEVAPSSGGGTRYADAVAINLWQSRGHSISGFEIKVSRGDWLKELKDPGKAEPICKFCDYWWILAPKGIIKDGELPPTWGLLELRPATIAVINQAPKLEAQQPTRAFFASLIRRAHEDIASIASRMQQEEIAKARSEIKKRVDEEVRRKTNSHEELRRHVAKFEQDTGLSLNTYSGPPIEIIKLAQRLQVLAGWSGGNAVGRIDKLAGDLDVLAAQLRKVGDDTGLRN